MTDKNAEIAEVTERALKDEKALAEVVEKLDVGTRRERQMAGAVVAQVAAQNPEMLKDHVSTLVDALNRPEAQTRWECLDALTCMIDVESRLCDKAVPGADTSLFDEDSGPARLSAMRFLCKLGATTPTRSEKVWPLIDEAIQCYHGDLEFNDMLIALVEFSEGKLAPSVKEELKDRMQFDADSNKGMFKRRAQQIIENVS